jgi:acyl-CoA thioesterase
VSSFDEDTAVHRHGDGWVGEISAGWNIGDNPNGGYTLAMIARALLGESGRADPLSVTAHYVRPPGPGEVEISVETVRAGRRYATLQGSMRQGDRELVRVLGAFGDLGAMSGPSRVAARPPAATPVERCLDLAAASEAAGFRPPEVINRYEIRLDPETQWVRSRAEYRARRRPGLPPAPEETEAALLEPLEIRGWIRFAEGAEPTSLGLLAMSDAFPPTLLGHQNVVWIPTVELTVEVRGRPAPGWILGVFRTRLLVDGLLEEDGELWDSAGRLVAMSRQLAIVLS